MLKSFRKGPIRQTKNKIETIYRERKKSKKKKVNECLMKKG